MPIQIIRNDITKMQVDAIVNAANETLLGGGGVDGAIHRAAGPQLLAECRTLGGCKTGQAKITKGYLLPCKYVIHTVGPIWPKMPKNRQMLLDSCYRNALNLAKQYACTSIAFPLISAGSYGCPPEISLKAATDAAREFLLENEMMVYIVVFDRKSFRISEKLYFGVAQYIDDVYAQEHAMLRTSRVFAPAAMQSRTAPLEEDFLAPENTQALSDALKLLDESFSQMLLRKIDEKGMKDTECYKRANLDRKLFSKIRSDIHYKPSKKTALALAIALELSLEETQELLKKAGFALSHSSRFDIIVEYCILQGIYDIFAVNELLFSFDQMTLGG